MSGLPDSLKVRCQQGLTLVEVLMAAVIFGIAVTAGTWVLTHAVRTQAALAQQPVSAALLAGHIHTLAERLTHKSSGMPPASLGSQVQALDNLNGAVFCPPIHSDLSSIDGAAAWCQQVDISLADPTAPTLTSPWTAAAAFGTEMIKLTVSITQNGRSGGTFTWWLNP